MSPVVETGRILAVLIEAESMARNDGLSDVIVTRTVARLSSVSELAAHGALEELLASGALRRGPQPEMYAFNPRGRIRAARAAAGEPAVIRS
jgi:hypothetical protein